MDLFKNFTFVRFCFASASMLEENLGLSTKQLICLYKECIEMAKHCYDIDAMMASCVRFVSHSNSLGRHADSLRCLKEILPSVIAIPRYELIVHSQLSTTYMELKEYDKVVLHTKKWIEIAQNTGDKEKEISGLSILGTLFSILRRYDDAIDCSNKGLEIAQETDSAQGEMMAYDCIMNACKCMKNYDDTIVYAHKVLDCAIKTNDKKSMITAYLHLEAAHLALEHFEEATDFGKKCIEIAREIEDKSGEVKAYQLMGEICKALSDNDNAIIYWNKCIELAITIGDKDAEVHAYILLGEIYHDMEHYQEATDFGKKIIEIARQIEDKGSEVKAYLVMGKLCNALSDNDNAIIYWKKCIELAITISDKYAEAQAYSLLGERYSSMGKYDDAISNCNKCIHIDKEDDEGRTADVSAYFTLGEVNKSLEKYDEGIQNFKQCIDIANRIGRKKEVKIITEAYLNLGEIYRTLNQHSDAVHYSKKCINMAQEINDKESQMKGHLCLVRVYIDSNQLNDAFLSIDAGMAIAKELGDKETEKIFEMDRFSLFVAVGLDVKHLPENNELTDITTWSENDLLEDLAHAVKTGDMEKKKMALLSLWRFYSSKNDYKKTINCLEQMNEMNIDRSLKLSFLVEIGYIYQYMCQDDIALRCYKEGLPTAESCSDNIQRSRFYHAIGQLLFSLDRELDLAERYLREAIRCFEVTFTNLGSRDELKISIFDQYIHSYKILALLLIHGERFQEALLVSDRCRARALKDLMILNFKMEQEESTDDHLEYSDVLSLVSRNDFSIAYYSSSHYPNSCLNFFLGEETNLHFSFCIDHSLQKDVDTLFDEMGVGEAVKCEDRSLDKEQDVQKEQKRSEEEYEGLNQPTALLLNLDCKRGESMDNRAETKGSILEVLFHFLDCDKILSSKQDEVVVIPEGPLYKVPFPALRDPRTGKYLSETKRIRLVPSLATLKMLQARTEDYYTKKGALIVGNPLVGKVMYDGEETEFSPLENAFAEVLAVGNVFKEKPLTGEKATKEAVTQRLKQGVAVVHIAAHGSLTKGTIALAPSREIRATKIPDEEDYMLTMADVQQTQVRAQLVVLSCCHSGRGEIRAQGVVGLCRAFLASGARAVVASLWAIDDEATCDFMFKFYTRLMDGKSASASLQQAMAEMRNDSDYSKPKYWAPFFLMGDDVTFKL